MHTFDILLQQIGLFIIYILAGVILVRTRVLSCETLEPISKFVLKMALPVMVFINITDGVERQVLYESWPIFVIAAIFIFLCMLPDEEWLSCYICRKTVQESIRQCCCSEILVS